MTFAPHAGHLLTPMAVPLLPCAQNSNLDEKAIERERDVILREMQEVRLARLLTFLLAGRCLVCRWPEPRELVLACCRQSTGGCRWVHAAMQLACPVSGPLSPLSLCTPTPLCSRCAGGGHP